MPSDAIHYQLLRRLADNPEASHRQFAEDSSVYSNTMRGRRDSDANEPGGTP